MLPLLGAFMGGGNILGFIGKYWKYLVLLAFIASIAWYHNHLLNTIKEKDAQIVQLSENISTLEANNITLQQNIVGLNETVRTLEKVREKDQIRILQLAKEERAARDEVLQLKQTFQKHDLNHLSIKKPGLIEKVINKGTDGVLKELEQLTDPDTPKGDAK